MRTAVVCAGGDYDMSWIVPHAISDAARDHLIRVTGSATTALLGRKNFEGFGGTGRPSPTTNTPIPAIAPSLPG